MVSLMKIHFSMAPDSLLPLIVLCSFLISLSVVCPESFHCGHLGELHFPFTTPECPQSSGLVPIRGCDDPKAAKLVGLPESQTRWEIKSIHPRYGNVFKILDHDLHDLLSSHKCRALANNLIMPLLPPSSSFNIVNKITLFRCNNSLHIRAPENYCFKYISCPGDHTYFFPNTIGPMDPEVHSSFSECSVIQLPFIPPPPDYTSLARDPFTFLTAEIVIEAELSGYCSECLGEWQCLFDEKCSEHKRRDSVAFIKGAATASAGVIIIVMFIILLLVMVQRYNCSGFLNQSRTIYFDIHATTNPECVTVDVGVPVFRYEELEKSTNNFDPSRELGHGGFGTVYYGKLSDGREAAVKRLYDHKRDNKRVKQFMNEIEAFTRLRHRNLVSLYGCTSLHSRGLLLAYEYISNGTVASHLYGDRGKPRSLPWPLRMNIAVETATALTYLHACNIIHRDVKTNNILLVNNFCVKVADFGISRLSPNDVSHVSTAPQGTMGYMDPEYVESHQLTNKSDVYGFGVVLIELISSMPPVDQTRKEDEIKLANLSIKKIQKREFIELVDPSLGFESDNEYRRMIISVAELAFQCLQRNKELRPSMYKVLDELQNIVSRKDEPDPLEIHGAGILRTDARTPPPTLPDRDEDGSVKKMQRLSLHRTLG